MKMRRSTLPRSSASAVLAFALAFSAAAATKPPAATSATSDEATTVFAGGTLGLNFPTIAVHCELALAPNRAELKGTWYKLEASFPVDFKKPTAPSSQGR